MMAPAGKVLLRFSNVVESALAHKVTEHNRTAISGHHATINQLRRVYRRGAGAFSPSVHTSMTRDQASMARVNAYLQLLKNGKPTHASYKQDNDILPVGHPCSTKGIAAAGTENDPEAEMYVEIASEESYANPEHALLAMAEFSGLGYEVIPALRAVWLRATVAGEAPFERAKSLATGLYASIDADLLPVSREG